jgi:beta-lactamase class D
MTENNWDKLFQDHQVKGTFVLKDLGSGKTRIYNKERSRQAFVPASTFKILNSIIALQVSSIGGVDDTIKWDGIDRGYALWNKDHTMRTAFSVSCVWFYQELARRIGNEQMQKWVNDSNYGNMNIRPQIDRFWLDGDLRISAQEQVNFIEKLIKDELPFDKDIQETVKNIMINDATDQYVVHAKTGWSQGIGWYVGYVESKENIWIFSLNIDLDNIDQAEIRKLLTYDILKEQKIIE